MGRTRTWLVINLLPSPISEREARGCDRHKGRERRWWSFRNLERKMEPEKQEEVSQKFADGHGYVMEDSCPQKLRGTETRDQHRWQRARTDWNSPSQNRETEGSARKSSQISPQRDQVRWRKVKSQVFLKRKDLDIGIMVTREPDAYAPLLISQKSARADLLRTHQVSPDDACCARSHISRVRVKIKIVL